jgi:hypothetical protein
MIKLKDLLSEQGGMKYSRGEWYNSNDDKSGSPIVVSKWDALVDEYNGKHGYSTSTKSDSRAYASEIGNLSVGMEWKVSFQNGNWRYQLYKLGQLANIFRNLDELISHFEDNNGGNAVSNSNDDVVQRFLEVVKTKFSEYEIKQKEDGTYEFIKHNDTPYARITFDPKRIDSPYAVSYNANFSTSGIRFDADAMKKELAALI